MIDTLRLGLDPIQINNNAFKMFVKTALQELKGHSKETVVFNTEQINLIKTKYKKEIQIINYDWYMLVKAVN